MIIISRNLKENVHNKRNIIDKNLNRTFRAENTIFAMKYLLDNLSSVLKNSPEKTA